VVFRKFHNQPTLSESIKLPQDHLRTFGMNGNVSFHLIVSFNLNWNGFKIELKNVIHQLTHQYYAMNRD
jgi:hypothetical protein